MAPEHLRFSAAVTAGGSSRRMGSDKAFIVIEGRTLVERAVAAAWAAGAEEVLVVGGDAERLAGLGLGHAADEHPGAGPLGAVVTALGCASNPAVLVMPCDLIAPSPAALREVVETLGDHDAALPVVDGRAQWATAAWSRRCLPALRDAFAAGVRAPRHAIGQLCATRFTPSDPKVFADADVPGDLPEGAAAPGTGAAQSSHLASRGGLSLRSRRPRGDSRDRRR